MDLFKKDLRMEYLLHPSEEDVAGLDESLNSLRGPSATAASPDLVFQYSAALISHVKPEYIKEGITLMEGLVFQYWQHERRRLEQERHAKAHAGELATAPPVSSDDEKHVASSSSAPRTNLLPVYYYYIALGWTKLDELPKARSCIERMLQQEPTNAQGLALRNYVEKQQTKEGVVGLAGLGVAVAAAAVVLGFLRRH